MKLDVVREKAKDGFYMVVIAVFSAFRRMIE